MMDLSARSGYFVEQQPAWPQQPPFDAAFSLQQVQPSHWQAGPQVQTSPQAQAQPLPRHTPPQHKRSQAGSSQHGQTPHTQSGPQVHASPQAQAHPSSRHTPPQQKRSHAGSPQHGQTLHTQAGPQVHASPQGQAHRSATPDAGENIVIAIKIAAYIYGISQRKVVDRNQCLHRQEGMYARPDEPPDTRNLPVRMDWRSIPPNAIQALESGKRIIAEVEAGQGNTVLARPRCGASDNFHCLL